MPSQEVKMRQKYEYKFVNFGQDKKDKDYHDVILENSLNGWRLVQVFAPGAGGLWAKANFCEVIFERQVEN
jgi:hypothetical protein